jgi:rhomboid protease GluP
MVALAAVWIVYLLECIYTWVTISTAFGVSTIPGVTLVKLGGNVALLVKLGQVYRLVTATLLHAGILHIFMNSASLLVFCTEVENSVNFALYLAVFLIGGIQGIPIIYVGNMLSDLYNLNLGNSVTVGVGASTSICAVMGLYIAKLYIESKKNGRAELAKRQIITMLVYLLVISLLPSVDFFGHFGSLISGALLGLAVVPRGDPEVKNLSWLGIGGLSLYTLILFTIFA